MTEFTRSFYTRIISNQRTARSSPPSDCWMIKENSKLGPYESITALSRKRLRPSNRFDRCDWSRPNVRFKYSSLRFLGLMPHSGIRRMLRPPIQHVSPQSVSSDLQFFVPSLVWSSSSFRSRPSAVQRRYPLVHPDSFWWIRWRSEASLAPHRGRRGPSSSGRWRQPSRGTCGTPPSFTQLSAEPF